MGFLARSILVISTLLIAVLYQKYRHLTTPGSVPTIELQEYWGAGDAEKYTELRDVVPFELNYEEKVIDTLKEKLANFPNLPQPLEGAAFQYGFNAHRLREIVDYWTSDYLKRWTERQSYLNQYPQFKTQIQGLEIHFLHVKPKNVRNPKRILPLLMLHGWPGSVREFYEIVPKLTTRSDEKEYVFEVIVPSLPGYGFSEGTVKQGLSPAKIAVIMRNLMARLGFKKYYVHGGDWGAIVGNLIATFFQSEVLGFHSTMCTNSAPMATVKTIIGSVAPKFIVGEEYVSHYYPLTEKFKLMLTETGYMHIQATKPDTIGTALTGNPIGLAAYILEKFSTWTNPAFRDLPDGGLEKYFTLDTLLDNIMIYYLTDSITTSQRLYSEAFNVRELTKDYDRIPAHIPTACAKFRYELFQQTDWALQDHFRNIIQSNHYDNGGHFVAIQFPDILYTDIVQFVNRLYRREDQY
ncbi:juvenile hormone epoxide hydrolase 1-like [Sabethes cyaneus]|uniref:juvenile hormone epoxide hydrolase 1-like n=1 Tax=Sabethes cyaneus TaxID=53552 RepID=UPI00237E0F9B|nr:juvenile hormone epoxide hydrolase 1-like [Sabethes cyaneus]